MTRFLDFEGVDAVLFDCDGVLVDSEPISEAAWRQTLESYGIDIGTFADWVGTTDEAIAVRYAADAGVSPAVLADTAAMWLVNDLREQPVATFDDALSLLADAESADVKLAVVTNSESWRLEAILSSAGLWDRFDVRVTSDHVRHPKPDPDVYLTAAQVLEVDSARCLVIEDSPTGVAAARAAGMRVVAIDRGVFGDESLAAATRVVTTLVEPDVFEPGNSPGH